jgi:hypothetical protein
MRMQQRAFRLIAGVATISLLYGQIVPPALAQAPPPPPAPGAQPQEQGDPPARVGRLAQITGTVSYHGQEDSEWSPASANLPVTAGNAFWTQPGAQADIEVSATRMTMAPGTELDVATLDETNFRGVEPQGEVYLRVRAGQPNESYSIQTPRGLVNLSAPGRYEIAAGSTDAPTLVTVVDGSAQITGPNLSLQVGPNQMATIIGSDTLEGSVGPAQPDVFLNAMVQHDQPPPQPAVAPPPAVAAMPGGDDLAQYGTWSDAPDYGAVWYPQVAASWVPYREGHWAYVPPWGWTWVDDAPWGFAPFHYGRWAFIGSRWGWVPGYAVGGPVYPVYAPALVTFFGVAAGVALGVGIGAALAEGRIGWCPLGPREAFHPWYRASDPYVRGVNVGHVTNVTINRNVTINNFANARGATVVPAAAMTGSRPIRTAAIRTDPATLAQAHPVIGQSPLRPTAGTAGMTPAVARGLALPASSIAHPAAPGPAIHPAAVSAGAAGAAHPLPPLHNPTPAAAAVHPPVPTPGATVLHTVPASAGAVPALRNPGAGPPPVTHIPTPTVTGPVLHAPPPAAAHTGAEPQPHAVAPPPVAHVTPPAAEAVHPTAPPAPHVAAPAVVHAPPPAAAHPPPAPQVHAPTPAAVHPPPAPAPHPAPAPAAVHLAPAPAPHPAPPPAAAHPAPAPAPHPQPQQKKPGEP